MFKDKRKKMIFMLYESDFKPVFRLFLRFGEGKLDPNGILRIICCILRIFHSEDVRKSHAISSIRITKDDLFQSKFKRHFKFDSFDVVTEYFYFHEKWNDTPNRHQSLTIIIIVPCQSI